MYGCLVSIPLWSAFSNSGKERSCPKFGKGEPPQRLWRVKESLHNYFNASLSTLHQILFSYLMFGRQKKIFWRFIWYHNDAALSAFGPSAVVISSFPKKGRVALGKEELPQVAVDEGLGLQRSELCLPFCNGFSSGFLFVWLIELVEKLRSAQLEWKFNKGRGRQMAKR